MARLVGLDHFTGCSCFSDPLEVHFCSSRPLPGHGHYAEGQEEARRRPLWKAIQGLRAAGRSLLGPGAPPAKQRVCSQGRWSLIFLNKNFCVPTRSKEGCCVRGICCLDTLRRPHPDPREGSFGLRGGWGLDPQVENLYFRSSFSKGVSS